MQVFLTSVIPLPEQYRRFSAALMIALMALSACAPPISYHRTKVAIPVSALGTVEHSDAVAQLKAAGADRDPRSAASRYFDAAWLANDKALAGDEVAMALYNHAVARLVATFETEPPLPWGATLELGEGGASRSLHVSPDPHQWEGKRRVVVADHLKFSGRDAQVEATREGLGAPVVAIRTANDDYRSRFESAESFVALTAVLRFHDAQSATLEFHDPLEHDRISLSGHGAVLAANFTAPVALALATKRLDRLGIVRMFNPSRFVEDAALIRLQNYDPDRIPVLMVHGLQSTSATWMLMYQHLLSDPELRDNFQFWVFDYPSGLPYPYTASLLRRELDGVRQAFPDHKNLILVGHSMGGIISRLMVTDAGDTIWTEIFGKSPDELVIPGRSSQLLLDALVFNNRDEVDRAVFIATPHRGSMIASSWIGRTVSRLVRLPSYLTDIRNDMTSVLTVDAAGLQLNFAPSSIDTLNPNNRFVREVNKLPVAPGTAFHSIIGDRGRGDTPDSSDGVVAYWSSHMADAASETIVPSDHSAHQNPEAIMEVSRILKRHLNER